MKYEQNGNLSVEVILTEFFKKINARFYSWEDCHRAFSEIREKGYQKTDREKLALHLAGYLASYGMYRGSSPLLQKYKYLIHNGVVDIIMDEKYSDLFAIDEKNFAEKTDKIKAVYDDIKKYYRNLGFDASKTLITKILLGTYCCVPAYDTFFVKGLSKCGIKNCGFEKLGSWLNSNPKFIEDLISFSDKEQLNYPLMKLVDMYFWEMGVGENK